MSRLSVFHPADNESGYVQAVIHENDTRAFIALGFVLSVDELQKQEQKQKQEQEQEQEQKQEQKQEQEQEQEQELPARRGRPPRSQGNSEE